MAPKNGKESLLDLCTSTLTLGNSIAVHLLDYLSVVKSAPHGFEELAVSFLETSRVLFPVRIGLAAAAASRPPATTSERRQRSERTLAKMCFCLRLAGSTGRPLYRERETTRSRQARKEPSNDVCKCGHREAAEDLDTMSRDFAAQRRSLPFGATRCAHRRNRRHWLHRFDRRPDAFSVPHYEQTVPYARTASSDVADLSASRPAAAKLTTHTETRVLGRRVRCIAIQPDLQPPGETIIGWYVSTSRFREGLCDFFSRHERCCL